MKVKSESEVAQSCPTLHDPMRKFETSHVDGATGRTPLIPRSALEKDPPLPLRPSPGGEGLLSQAQAVRPQPDLLTFGWHVGQGCEFLGVDEGDVKCGLHGGLVKAGEGLPGIC